MVYGVYTSAPASARQGVAYPPLAMAQREALALTHLILAKRLEEAKNRGRAGSARKGDQQQQRKRKRITVEEKLVQLDKQEVGLKEKLQRLEAEKHDCFKKFREILAQEDAEKKRRELEERQRRLLEDPKAEEQLHKPHHLLVNPSQRISLLNASASAPLKPLLAAPAQPPAQPPSAALAAAASLIARTS